MCLVQPAILGQRYLEVMQMDGGASHDMDFFECVGVRTSMETGKARVLGVSQS
jgi:hypothetical protein